MRSQLVRGPFEMPGLAIGHRHHAHLVSSLTIDRSQAHLHDTPHHPGERQESAISEVLCHYSIPPWVSWETSEQLSVERRRRGVCQKLLGKVNRRNMPSRLAIPADLDQTQNQETPSFRFDTPQET
jgi:hypothetical protein